jgi:amino acid adenylation domain-containing protein
MEIKTRVASAGAATARFWAEIARKVDPLIDLPLSASRTARVRYVKLRAIRELPADLSAELDTLGTRLNATAAELFLTAVAVLLARYCAASRFAVGVDPQALAGRHGSATWQPLPLAIEIEDGEGFATLLERLRHARQELLNHADPGLPAILSLCNAEHTAAYHPMFQTAFEFAAHSDITECGKQSHCEGGIDLIVSVIPQSGGYGAIATYNGALLARPTIQRLLANFETLLRAIVREPDGDIGLLELVSAEEQGLCRQPNSPAQPVQGPSLVHQLFEQQAASTPGRLSYVFESVRLDYNEFNRACNKVARLLRTLGVRANDAVGLLVPRSHWIGVGALGTFKAGGVHVPLDPGYPPERLDYMVAQTRPRIVLTVEALRDRARDWGATVVALDTQWGADIEPLPAHDLEPAVVPGDTAYIFFTSGTTGLPKAIRMSHRAFRNMAIAHRSGNLVHEDNRTLQFASHSFAVCLGGSFMAWLGGGAVFQVNDAQSVPGPALLELLRGERINMVSWPVSLLTTFPTTDLPDLTIVISTAEPCTDFIVQKWALPGRRFINMYGSSEVAMGSTLFEWGPGKRLSIGRPFPNVELYVLDRHLRLVPLGAVGELCTGGVPLADGYLGKPELTDEKFVPNPFSDVPGARLYRSGDLGRYLPNGEIQYVGRADFQVNIRGFRVELAEIEKRLLLMKEVREAAVSARPDRNGSSRLVAYLSLRTLLPRAELRSRLLDALPQYMVPSVYVFMDALPLTPNRKLDRLRLPEPDIDAQIDSDYVAPATREERFLATLWEELLQLPRVGRSQNFFEIGGHSLVAAEMISRINEETAILLPVAAVFDNPTVGALAKRIELPPERSSP